MNDLLSSLNAYIDHDRQHEAKNDEAEARDAFIATEAEGLYSDWKTDLRTLGCIDDIKLDTAEILAEAVLAQVSFDKYLRDSAEQYVIDHLEFFQNQVSPLTDLSWN